MGKNPLLRPAFTKDIASLIAGDVPVRATCDTCDAYRDLDLKALAEAIGGERTLWGKRTRCRLTEGCQGRNRFYYGGRGTFQPMWDGL